MILLLLAGACLVLALWLVATWNGLIQVKHEVSRALANIDVLLKQRHDELPKLIETCKQYRQFEQDTLQRVVTARAAVQRASASKNIAQLGNAEGELRGSLGRLFALAEAYPDLKTNESFLALQSRISALENGIADRREVYNESANINNVRLEQFPANLVALFGSFRSVPLLHFSSGEMADPDVKALFA
jgi:LemA protein